MTTGLIWIIDIYRRFAPAWIRNRCIFEESCSAHVRRVAVSEGAAAALGALRLRMARCRPGYRMATLLDERGGLADVVVFADGGCAPLSAMRSETRPV